MLIQCTNKGCRQLADVLLDPETNEVICTLCQNPIANITDFVKRTLRANKQFVKRKNTGSNFNAKCAACGQIVAPEIDKDNKIVCTKCRAEIKLSKAFENVFRQSYKKA